ncbi:MAG: hypothetical protein HND51_17220 [Chloroflexi bacterium]|nr:hypothetical protein [Chloroflexota bacterium]
MAEQVVRLVYPPALSNVPVINRLIRNYNDLSVNIIRADTSSTQAWLECQLVGSPGLIEGAIDWLRGQGIEVQTLGA